ncbi:hypothetical protein SAMN05428957_102131 [Oryzisolibacter propanilivorax]|uniref:Uncharacterized protein n=1 Tax=Oryzisolibacter propanilivorax TaxID=1527607 RepID=A0A1G9Q890_9BURK|nr:hypothetical protein [Oryzisolibacter propanilivorax]SDM07292.1 hypothetical protein SAMN05428957_102131 [Oryzisolibacter propanilivorax]
MKQHFVAPLIAFTASLACAQVPVDLSQATLTLESSQTLRVENLQVPGLGSYRLDFQWDPGSISFVPVVASLLGNGSYCERARASGNVGYVQRNKDGYLLRQRTDGAVTVGALSAAHYGPSAFTVTWAKTASAAANPYLVDRLVPDFDPVKAYGVMGTVQADAYPGFETGMLVEVVGNLAGGAFTVRQVGGSAQASFSFPATQTQARANCPASASGVYSGNVAYGTFAIDAYQVSFINGHEGSVMPLNDSAHKFSASWNADTAGMAGFNHGRTSKVLSPAFPGFAEGADVFLADVGDGLAVTQTNAASRAVATTVFLK